MSALLPLWGVMGVGGGYKIDLLLPLGVVVVRKIYYPYWGLGRVNIYDYFKWI